MLHKRSGGRCCKLSGLALRCCEAAALLALAACTAAAALAWVPCWQWRASAAAREQRARRHDARAASAFLLPQRW
jgi:hypothetical protein